MGDNYGELLAQQVGGNAAGAGVGAIFDIALQPWRNRNQLEQNKKLQAQQIAGQKEMGIFNREQAMQMWHDTNAEAQMKHIKNAGLNPALMYGSGGPGGTTAGATPGSVGGGMADPKAGGGHIGMNILMPAQVELMRAQARNLDADTAKKSGVETELGQTTIQKLIADTANVKVQTGLARIQKEIAEITQEDITDMASLNAQKIQQEVFQLKNQTDISDATKQTIIQTIRQEYVNKVITAAVMKSGMQVNAAQISKMSQEITQGYIALGQKGQEINLKGREVNQKSEEIDMKRVDTILHGMSDQMLQLISAEQRENLNRAIKEIMKKIK